jgi:aldose 1-epimerase
MSNYTARSTAADGVQSVHLGDAARNAEASIAISIGNMAYEYLVRDRNYLWFPYQTTAEFKQSPKFCGIPFLAPWANRLDGDGFWANGHRYTLNPDLHNFRRDSNKLPIHGLLNFSPLWELIEARADDHSAWSTSRMDFWRYPEMMAQFPFAHAITVTHRLRDGVLEVETAIENRSAFPMPLAIGFHPYFQLHEIDRDEWKLYISASEHLKLNKFLVPTGEAEAFSGTAGIGLRGHYFDDGYTKLLRGPDGRAKFRVECARESLSVSYGPKYTAAVVFAPPNGRYVCFEPMTAVTNGFNAAHDGWYKDLQSIPPDGYWRESFWIDAT